MRLAVLWLSLVCSVVAARPAWAESQADRTTARALALEGHTALQNRDYEAAVDRFTRADSLVHAPTLVVDLARALQGLGRLVEAHEKYELVLREGVNESSPKSWLRALEDAKREVEALKPRLAWIRIVLTEPTEATVTLDGAKVPAGAIGVKRAADPGSPVVRVTAEGYEPYEQTLTIASGEEKAVEVALKKLPEVEAASTEAAPTDTTAPASASKGRKVLTYIALGVGGAGLVAGSVTGALALGKRSDLSSQCPRSECPPSAAQSLNDYRLFGTISGVGFVVGAIGIGTGLVLLLTSPSSEESPPTAGLQVRPLIGLGVVGAQGTFQ